MAIQLHFKLWFTLTLLIILRSCMSERLRVCKTAKLNSCCLIHMLPACCVYYVGSAKDGFLSEEAPL